MPTTPVRAAVRAVGAVTSRPGRGGELADGLLQTVRNRGRHRRVQGVMAQHFLNGRELAIGILSELPAGMLLELLFLRS